MEAYKERMKTEYNELDEKTIKLHSMLIKYNNGTLGFELNCPIELLRSQYHIMCAYLNILQRRADIEGVEL